MSTLSRSIEQNNTRDGGRVNKAHIGHLKSCRLCGCTKLYVKIDLGIMALTGVFPKPDEDVMCGPLRLIECADCGLIQLGDNYDLNVLYGGAYGYRSGLNRSMISHLKTITDSVDKFLSLKPGDLVIDIGSNDGTLLSLYDTHGLHLLGIDPQAGRLASSYPAGSYLIDELFSYESVSSFVGDKKAKVITSIAMFYDLPDPIGFALDVLDLLDEHDGIWIFEQSYLPSMISSCSYDTICHEHLEYYDLRIVNAIVESAGGKIIDVQFNDTNGGSFCVTAARKESKYEVRSDWLSVLLKQEASWTGSLNYMYGRALQNGTALINLLSRMQLKGKKVLGYGASTKGNVLLQFCRITPDLLPAIAEVNEEKFGCVTPGTGIPIIAEEEVRKMKPDAFLVLPWHFRDNIIEKEANFLNNGGQLIFPLPDIEIVGN